MRVFIFKMGTTCEGCPGVMNGILAKEEGKYKKASFHFIWFINIIKFCCMYHSDFFKAISFHTVYKHY